MSWDFQGIVLTPVSHRNDLLFESYYIHQDSHSPKIKSINIKCSDKIILHVKGKPGVISVHISKIMSCFNILILINLQLILSEVSI